MNDNPQTEVKEINANIGGGRHIAFKSVESYLLFAAFMGQFEDFRKAYKAVYPDADVTPRIYRRYCNPSRRPEFQAMAESTQLSDGTLLLDALKALKKG